LKEVVPKLSRVTILHPGGSADEFFVQETQAPARGLGVQLVSLVTRGPDNFADAFRAMTKTRSQALLMRLPGNGFHAHFKSVAQLAAKNRLPSISPSTDWSEAGGLMTYGSDINNRYRRTAIYVDKILKGAKPADLPVEAPIKFELKINLNTAKQIGLTIPPNVLARADKVIR
jgi:putative ABC transport system substrate-binding protein